MAGKEARERKLKEIQEIAEGWGKMIAREAFPDGPGLDVTLADMEEYAVAASRALVKGAVESMTATQGEQLGEEAPCPTCGQLCPLKRKRRRVTFSVKDSLITYIKGQAEHHRTESLLDEYRRLLRENGDTGTGFSTPVAGSRSSLIQQAWMD